MNARQGIYATRPFNVLIFITAAQSLQNINCWINNQAAHAAMVKTGMSPAAAPVPDAAPANTGMMATGGNMRLNITVITGSATARPKYDAAILRTHRSLLLRISILASNGVG